MHMGTGYLDTTMSTGAVGWTTQSDFSGGYTWKAWSPLKSLAGTAPDAETAERDARKALAEVTS